MNYLEDSKVQYNIGFRTGMAIAAMEMCERIVKMSFPDQYKIIKYKIRRLSEYEAEHLMYKLIKDRDVNFLSEFL